MFDGADSMDGGTGDDVMLGDNGRIIRSDFDDLHDVLKNKIGCWWGTPWHTHAFLYEYVLLEKNSLGGNDTMTGSDGNDKMFGQTGDDKMYGVAGDDNMIGGLGNDYMDGGVGNDILLGDRGTIYSNGHDWTLGAALWSRASSPRELCLHLLQPLLPPPDPHPHALQRHRRRKRFPLRAGRLRHHARPRRRRLHVRRR